VIGTKDGTQGIEDAGHGLLQGIRDQLGDIWD
jgi:hypothetical protein